MTVRRGVNGGLWNKEQHRQEKRELGWRRFRRGVGAIALSGALIWGADIAADECYNVSSAKVRTIETNSEKHRHATYEPNREFLVVRGFAREVSCDMAEQLSEVTQKYGNTRCLEYNQKEVNSSEIVQKLEEAYELDKHPEKAVDMNIYAQSAGLKIILPSIAKLVEKHPKVRIDTIIGDCAPFDADDVRSGVARNLIESRDLIYAGRIALTLGQVASLHNTYGASALDTKTWESAYNLATGMRVSGLRHQAAAIAQPLPFDARALTKNNIIPVQFVYTKPLDSNQDSIVYVDTASQKWRNYFANGTERKIDNGGHSTLLQNERTQAYLDATYATYSQRYPAVSLTKPSEAK